jgi:hypothetical protein
VVIRTFFRRSSSSILLIVSDHICEKYLCLISFDSKASDKSVPIIRIISLIAQCTSCGRLNANPTKTPTMVALAAGMCHICFLCSIKWANVLLYCDISAFLSTLSPPFLEKSGGGGIRTHAPTKSGSGFQDRHHKPLGHPSVLRNSTSKRPLQAILPTLRRHLYQTLTNMDDIRAGGARCHGHPGVNFMDALLYNKTRSERRF